MKTLKIECRDGQTFETTRPIKIRTESHEFDIYLDRFTGGIIINKIHGGNDDSKIYNKPVSENTISVK